MASADHAASSGADTIPLLILGAGPAGIATALYLLQHDPAWAKCMIVLEKAAHPRPKLCGGGVTYYGLKCLQSLGLSLPLPIPQVQIDEIQISYGRRTIHLYGNALIVVFERQVFDAYLAQHARQLGVEIHENEPALSLDVDSNGALVTTSKNTYRTRLVVGADGCNGVARRTINRGNSRRQLGRLIVTHPPASVDDPLFSRHRVRFDFTPARAGLQGYIWQFPMLIKSTPAYNLGVYDALIARNGRRARLPELLAQGCRINGVVMHAIAGHPVHCFHPLNRFSQPHLLLVGDAAGVDPLFAEGIAPSLNYGCLAAAVAQDAFDRNDFSLRHYRRLLLTSPLGQFLLFHWASAELLYRFCRYPGFMYLVWQVGKVAANLWNAPEFLPNSSQRI